MGKKDPRVDAYIAKSADFSKPILKHLRKLVHTACPKVEEDVKWSSPTYMYKGILCGMAGFKEHAIFGFWKQRLMADPKKLFKVPESAMGSMGRLTSLSQLPPDKALIAYIKEAMRLNDEGIKVPKQRKFAKKPLRVPDYLKRALAKNKKAQATFDGFNYSNKKEYVEWVMDAKTEETRYQRLKTAVEWMAQGKVRNWKYIR